MISKDGIPKKFMELIVDEVYDRLVWFDGNKTRVAESFGLSIRTIRNYVRVNKDHHPIGFFHIEAKKKREDTFLVRPPFKGEDDE